MTTSYIKIFLCASLLSSILFSQSDNRYLIKGDDYYKKFDLINAAKNYEYAYEQNPKNYNVLEKLTKIFNDLGEYYIELKETKKAEEAITSAVRYAEIFYALFSDSAKTHTLLAMSYGNLALFKGGNEKIKLAEKIRENAEKSIELNPNDYLPYIILGIYNRQIASLSWFERAFANTFLGKVPEGSFSAAEHFLLKALQIQPGMITAMFNLSLVYKEMDDERNEVYWLKKIVDAPITDFRDKYSKMKAKERLNELLN
jgi:tetratricopeptide (TPR) repeat protein